MSYVHYSKVKYSLAVTLMPHYPQLPTTYGIVKSKGEEILEYDVITERNWILIGAGEMRNLCNPDLENLFEKNEIQNCSTQYFPNFRKTSTYCPLTNRIWKVRYDQLPDDIKKSGVKDYDAENSGWATNKMHPSNAQMEILKKYGIQTVSDAIYGDSLWHFLNDINDPNWIKNYISN